MASPSRRRTRAQSAWNVPAWTSRPPSPTRLMIRSRSSAAALFVNVTARIRKGGTPLTPTRYAIRCARTRVFPEPAPARISNGPSVVVTARACSGLSARRICASRSARRFARTSGSGGGAGGAVGSRWGVAADASRSHSGSSGTASDTSAVTVPGVPRASSRVGSPVRRRLLGLTPAF